MKKLVLTVVFLWFVLYVYAQNGNDSIQITRDTTQIQTEEDSVINRQKVVADSLKKQSEKEIKALKNQADSLREAILNTHNKAEAKRLKAKSDSLSAIADTLKIKSDLDYLKANARPVVLGKDTLFYVYVQLGPYTPQERARAIEERLQELVSQFSYTPDSLLAQAIPGALNIAYGNRNRIILSILPGEAEVQKKTPAQVAKQYIQLLKINILQARKASSLRTWIIEIALTILALLVVYILYRLVNRLFKYLLEKVYNARKTLFKGFIYKNYEAVSAHQQLRLAFFLLKTLRLLTHLLILYLTLPVIFSIFPATKGIASTLLSYILNPLGRIGLSFVNYIPNLFTIIVIYICTRYVVRFLYFLAKEIETEKLVINGFYPEWATTTFNIVRVLVYAFMFVIIFPYLPGSESPVFKGVSVFLGVLFSLGSSSAISNMVAGIVITYMRPFRINDRIKLGEVIGQVMEKNMLVTRIRTIKNEEITIPNSSILSNHIINYTSSEKYLIHSTVTIGYDVPWREVHQLLIGAADSCQWLYDDPKPFVLQTSLDDFYVSYEINAYITDTAKLPEAYSEIHQNIQDKFNEAGIEILSPHYRAMRDGNQVTNPADYLPKDYEVPYFRVKSYKNGEK